MFIRYRTQGFIVKKVDRGEASRIFIIYTRDFGKLKVLAKAERKIKSKLRGGLGLFYLSEIEFIQGKTYITLTDVILINSFLNIRKNLERLKIAYKISGALDGFINFEEKDEKIWNLLLRTLKELNNCKLEIKNSLEIRNWKLEIIYYYFLWNLFSLLGYSPELYRCAFCQKKFIPQKLYFIPEAGGIICESCFKKTKKTTRALMVNPNTVKILRIILEKKYLSLKRLKVGEKEKEELKAASDSYLSQLRGPQLQAEP